MREIWENYKLKVLADYQRKRENGLLSFRLTHPAPAKLRDECTATFAERYDRKDEKTLRDFFGPFPDQASCLKAINKWDINKFKPLMKLMMGEIKKPGEINVELLAWLIDFQPRPFDPYKKYQQEVQPLERELIKAPDDPIEISSIVNSGKPYSRLKFNIGISAAISVIIICMIAFFYFSGPQSCMYWTGDHYEKIDCNQKVNALTIALDSERLMHFRRITNPDTITYRSKGYVWYSKINNKLEFFTSAGNHPTEIYNTLRPISDHIIKKYCLRIQ